MAIKGFEVELDTICERPVIFREDLITLFFFNQIIKLSELEATKDSAIDAAQCSTLIIRVCEGERCSCRCNTWSDIAERHE